MISRETGVYPHPGWIRQTNSGAKNQVAEAAQRKKRRWWDPRHHGFQYSTDLGKI